MYVVNVVDRIDMVNFGIWNAAIATAPVLREKYGVKSQLWFPAQGAHVPDYLSTMVELKPITSLSTLPDISSNTIIVTHGCWRMPTRIGIKLKNKGFPWVYVPHGMLEPWSLSQKWYIKYPYFWLFEKKWSLQANLVRAVSQPEGINLQKIYPHVVYIPNGNKPPQNLPSKIWNVRPLNFLFLGRLHKKKGLIPLVKSWKLSKLNNDPNYQLIIAGPDDGLLHQLSNELKSSNNISYVGPVFGQAKEQLLKNSHFFLLPSYSEGFPTSVVEAMQYGLIPVISEGCNFPEVFANQLAFKAEPNINSIKNALELVVATQNIALIADKCQKFATEQFSIEHIADLQYQCYSSLL